MEPGPAPPPPVANPRQTWFFDRYQEGILITSVRIEITLSTGVEKGSFNPVQVDSLFTQETKAPAQGMQHEPTRTHRGSTIKKNRRPQITFREKKKKIPRQRRFFQEKKDKSREEKYQTKSDDDYYYYYYDYH